ncbi:MAG: sugar ABC transporter substrate-binding protein [Phyllobacteriaceae bacterium]|nr:sugar ABC transporter substrate-binding protein [Nitratireductor sp.]MCO5134286.1 sugar ABC transporter substrate-binding protein [Phyllobacteriaceae bacterium]
MKTTAYPKRTGARRFSARPLLAAGLLGLASLAYSGAAQAIDIEGIPDPTIEPYVAAMKGKTIGYVPFSMSYDLSQGWYAGMKIQAEELGYEIVVRDPNWNTDVGVQAMEQLINSKPDIIVLQNPDLQSYAKLLKRGTEAGINFISVNIASAYPTYYIGEVWQLNGVKEAEYIVEKCGEGTGRSGKVAIIQGILTSAASATQIRGVTEVLSKHPEIQVVSNQSANWDAGKANEITKTVLQQHPDLCGVIGFWDGMDIGAGSAVKEAGLQDQVFVVSSGGGNKEAACDRLEDGTYSAYFSYDVREQAQDINSLIRIFLQNPPAPDAPKFTLPTRGRFLTKDNIGPGSCWTMDDFK